MTRVTGFFRGGRISLAVIMMMTLVGLLVLSWPTNANPAQPHKAFSVMKLDSQDALFSVFRAPDVPLKSNSDDGQRELKNTNLTDEGEGHNPPEGSEIRGLSVMFWDYSWPHNGDNTCRCEESQYGEFSSEAACLSAFAQEERETCQYNGAGLTYEQCEFAVSTELGYDNGLCKGLCETLVKFGPQEAAFGKFQSSCQFEFFHFRRGAANPEGNCFDNWVYGLADTGDLPETVLDPRVGHKIFLNVETPSECQLKCQEDDSCESFLWRRYPHQDDLINLGTGLGGTGFNPMTTEHPGLSGGAHTPPYSCILKSRDLIQAALDVKPDQGGTPSPSDPSWGVCNLHVAERCSQWPNECHQCDCTDVCVWRSTQHLSGPKYCTGRPTDICHPTEKTTEMPSSSRIVTQPPDPPTFPSSTIQPPVTIPSTPPSSTIQPPVTIPSTPPSSTIQPPVTIPSTPPSSTIQPPVTIPSTPPSST
eukprot:Polyplicarium_translucidae@DN1531_c0_g1_i1.p1